MYMREDLSKEEALAIANGHGFEVEDFDLATLSPVDVQIDNDLYQRVGHLALFGQDNSPARNDIGKALCEIHKLIERNLHNLKKHHSDHPSPYPIFMGYHTIANSEKRLTELSGEEKDYWFYYIFVMR